MQVRADTTVDIVITAQGFIGEAPSGLTITYISDYELGISWIKGTNTTNTTVRAAYGRPVGDRIDGFEIYYGTGNSTIMWVPNIGTIGPIYLKAWGQRADGIWEEIGTTAEANFMSMSFLFITIIILGLTLFIVAFRWKDILLSYSAALTWMAIGFWWILGDITNFGLSEPWVKILVFIPFILSFTVLFRLWNTEITMESKGRKWTEWGATPKEEGPNRREEYRKLLRERRRR
jgi:hypothetical protein